MASTCSQYLRASDVGFMRKVYGTFELVFAQFEVRSADDDIVQNFSAQIPLDKSAILFQGHTTHQTPFIGSLNTLKLFYFLS